MKKILHIFLVLNIFIISSCDDNGEAIYSTRKLVLQGEAVSDYGMEYKVFSWNDIDIGGSVRFLMVKSVEMQDESVYFEIAMNYVNEYYYDSEYWGDDCYVEMTYSDNEYSTFSSSEYYYKLIAYNEEGYIIMSNFVYL